MQIALGDPWFGEFAQRSRYQTMEEFNAQTKHPIKKKAKEEIDNIPAMY
jgi:hypothetical protein